MIRTFIAAALAAALAAPAAHAEDYAVSGQGMGMTKMTAHEVGEGHMLMELHTEYSDFQLDTADHPMAGMSGPCFGAAEVAQGMASGGGKCLYTDAGGDHVTMEWRVHAIQPDGTMSGTWNVSGGTGKWMDASGGGGFSSLSDPASGESVNTVMGSIMLP